MGAWIEIIIVALIIGGLSVAPLVGAWIEITLSEERFVYGVVAPLVGAWIEMFLSILVKRTICRSSRGSVD